MHATPAVRIVEVDPGPANALAAQQLLLEDFRSALPVGDEKLRLLVFELDRPAVDLSRMTGLVRSDASLAFQILGLANLSGSVEDCDLVKATVLTGKARLRAMASRISALNARCPAAPQSLLQHTQLAAKFSRLLAERTGSADLEVAYLGGLLHDIGKLISPLSEDSGGQARVGAWLAAAWGIPKPIASAITRQEEKARPARGLLACVKVANTACNLFGIRSEAFAFGRYELRCLEPVLAECFPESTAPSITDMLKALEAEFLKWAWSHAHLPISRTSQGGLQ